MAQTRQSKPRIDLTNKEFTFLLASLIVSNT